MKFYIDKDSYKELKQDLGNESFASCIIFLYKNYDELNDYEVKLTVKKITKEPFKQTLIRFWNNFVKIFII